MKKIDLGKISVPTDEYASQGNAILGIRDSGKSYTATAIAEQLNDAKIPFIAFDPIGIWRYLRVPGAGAGYKVVVAGGQHGDLPLTARGAQEIVRAAMRENVSLVVDLYDIHLSKADWREVVGSSIRTLLYENGNHGLRHIFIEEAAEFCPQQVAPDQGRVYAEVEKLARMGGNALLGYTLINQRAEQVNKAVLELCDCLILHRQKGRNSINALSKWLDIASVGKGADIVKSLPALAQGECWVWPAGSDTPVRTKIPAKHSFHPDRRARHAAPKTREREVDVSAFVETMKGSLEALTREAAANDPKLLRAENARLTRELAKKAPATAVAGKNEDAPTVRAMRRALEEAMKLIVAINAKDFFTAGGEAVDKAQIEKAIASAAESVKKLVEAHLAQRNRELDALKKQSERVLKNLESVLGADVTVQVDVRHNEPFTVSAAPPRPQRPKDVAPPSEGVSAPQQRILDALAWMESVHVVTTAKVQLALLADQSPTSSGYANNLGALRSAGLIEYPGPGRIGLTPAGRTAARAPERAPTTEDLHHQLEQRLAAPQWRILRALIDAYPSALAKDDLAQRSEQSPTSSGYANNLGALRSLGFIDYPGARQVAALPILFL